MTIEKIKNYFDRAVDVILAIILIFIIIGIAIGTAQLFTTTWKLFELEGITGHYIDIISDVFTLYVLIELSKSLVEYFSNRRLRLTFIVDGAIVFVLRELLIGLFKHELKAEMIYAFSCLLFVLGALRIASILVYHREKRVLQESV